MKCCHGKLVIIWVINWVTGLKSWRLPEVTGQLTPRGVLITALRANRSTDRACSHELAVEAGKLDTGECRS
ncbi:hypothetical protein HanIR_Chr15g0754781 [Helianthus annuus]|nr:hypothetical protein HanIR_Chr15g0754781 [Helianthus annuus]